MIENEHLIHPRVENLRKELLSLIMEYPIYAIKTGTETEDMSMEEIFWLNSICNEILPLIVKIGGPEAKNDMRGLQKIGVQGISSPMIESPYALKNFISSLEKTVNESYYHYLRKSINIETITGYRNLIDIIEEDAYQDLIQVTAARSDLSASMGLEPDDVRVMEITRDIIQIVKSTGKETSVGGSIGMHNFSQIAEDIQPKYVNSRHVVVRVEDIINHNHSEIVSVMLGFEIKLYQFFSELVKEKEEEYLQRIQINKKRMEMKSIYYSY